MPIHAALKCAVCIAAVPWPALLAQAKGTDFARDVEYLLTELGKQAAPLLREKKVDWPAVRAEFTKRVKAVRSEQQHVELCRQLLARLQDGHAGFTAMHAKLEEPAPQYGVGVTLCETASKVYVKNCFGPASDAGIASGFEVSTIDGVKASDWITAKAAELAQNTGFSTAHAARYAASHWGLAGESGKTVTLELDRGKSGKKKVRLTYQKSGGTPQYIGPLFPIVGLEQLGRRGAYGKLESGLGYVYLRDCADELPAELDTALAALHDAPGLILDMRANGGGGTDHAAVFGRFLAPGTKWQQYESCGSANFAGPMVVIVDAGTRSTGETISGQFKEDGRAYMIGTSATAGMSASKVELEVPSKLFKVRFAVNSNKQRFQGGKGIEGLGVAPHEIVAWRPEAMQKGVDPLILRAEELLREGFPKGAVRYVPPERK